MKKLTILILAALSVVACRHQEMPADVIAEDRMVDFLTDAYMVEGFYAIETQYRYDVLSENALRGYDSILEVHGFTREQVEKSFDYYSQHLEQYAAIHDSVVARLEERQHALPADAPASPVVADSVFLAIPRLVIDK